MTAENTPNGTAPDTIGLVHGLWVTPRSWEHWIEHYENKGYRVLAPAYPGLEVEALNEDPSPIEALTIPGVVEHLESIVGELENPPIIMGHSAGVLFTQILLEHFSRWLIGQPVTTVRKPAQSVPLADGIVRLRYGFHQGLLRASLDAA